MGYKLVAAKFIRVESPFSVVRVILDLDSGGGTRVTGHLRFENDGREFEVDEDLRQHETEILTHTAELLYTDEATDLLMPELNKGMEEYEKQQQS